jgi:hypothetical protein
MRLELVEVFDEFIGLQGHYGARDESLIFDRSEECALVRGRNKAIEGILELLRRCMTLLVANAFGSAVLDFIDEPEIPDCISDQMYSKAKPSY